MLKNTVDRRPCSTSVSHSAKIDYNPPPPHTAQNLLCAHQQQGASRNNMWFHGSPGMTSPTPLRVHHRSRHRSSAPLPTLPHVGLPSLFESCRPRTVIDPLPTSTDILGGLKSRNTKNIYPGVFFLKFQKKQNISDFQRSARKTRSRRTD